MAVETVVGQGEYTYEVDKQWGRRGALTAFGVSQGVSGDSQDRVYVFQRAPIAQVMVFDPDGTLVKTWGEGKFMSPHGIWFAPDDTLYITDTLAHTVTHWTKDGELLRTWGNHGQPGEWGVPFNRPTKAVLAPDGEMYVSDGYGNKHVHRFDENGELIGSFGDKGEGPGQFVLPHDVVVHEDKLLVCDREARRVQQFDRAGKFLGEWRDLQNPMQIFIRDGVLHMVHAYAEVSVRKPDGEVLARWPYESVLSHDKEKSPHSVWVDSRGDIYVAEVVGENGFQKFVRRK